jgi:transposase
LLNTNAVETLQTENEKLRAEIEILQRRASEVDNLQLQNEALSEELAWYRRYFLHRRSDVIEHRSQQPLPFNEAELLSEEAQEGPGTRQQIGSYTRGKPARRPLPENLPRTQQVIDIPEDQKRCACGSELSRIGEEKSEKLDIEPPRLRVIEQIRPKYACRACEGSGDEDNPAVRIAPPPPTLIPAGIATPGLVAFVVISKFEDALPLYRQEKQFARLGVELSRRTMADWMIASAAACRPVLEALQRRLRSGPAILIDETTVQVMREPGRSNTSDSYVWAAVGGEPEHPVMLYRYEPTRSGNVVLEILEEYEGYAQTDGFGGYDWSIATLEKVTHVGCMAHVRRKFTDALNIGKNSPGAREAVTIIGKIYGVERELAGWPRNEAFRHEREQRVRPLLDELKDWLEKKSPRVPPTTALGKAVTYALKQWPKVDRYLECEHLTPDTNRVENLIRPFVVGRKNWLFSGSPRGANASMTLYSLIQTAKANKVEPYWYLRALFDRLPTFDPAADYDELLPWSIFRATSAGP